jgi:integrase
MASVICDPEGFKRIQFVAEDGTRRAIRLGKMDKKQADAICVRVEILLAASISGVVDRETSVWVRDLDSRLHERFARVGLVEPRERVKPNLGRLLDAYFENLTVKPGTERTYKQARQSLEAFFGVDRMLSTIKPLDAQKWRQSMVEEGLAIATIAKRVKVARAVFAKGIKWEYLTANPLADVEIGSMKNRKRLRFVERADIERVLAACPDPAWRALIALARYGALRVPSEALLLRWDSVDWETGRMTVFSPKTEGTDKASRLVPIFPELRPHLLAAFEAAPDGSEFVVERFRDPGVNLRTQLLRLLTRAGVKPWPRLWQNLRASRATELSAEHPQHVAAAWCGHTEAVAEGHYWQVRDSDFEKALAGPKAAQNPAQSEAESAGTGGNEPDLELAQVSAVPVNATPDTLVPGEQVTPLGFEPKFSG